VEDHILVIAGRIPQEEAEVHIVVAIGVVTAEEADMVAEVVENIREVHLVEEEEMEEEEEIEIKVVGLPETGEGIGYARNVT